MKKWIVLLLALLLIFLCGCQKNSDVDVILESTATPSPTVSASPTPTATPALTATPTPTPTVAAPTPNVSEEIDAEVVDAGFDELYKKSEYVLLGKLTKSLGEWNQARDAKGNASTTIFMMEQQYNLVISEVLKGDKIKAKDSITLSLPYRDKYAGEKDYTMRVFQEPPLNQDMLFFLNLDNYTEGIIVYYPEVEPHSFLLKDGKLYTYGNAPSLAKSFAGGKGAADKGITLTAAKKEMGIK